MTGKQHTAQNVSGPVITITTIRHSLQWHTLSSRTVKPLIFFSLFFTSLLFVSCSHSLSPDEKPFLTLTVEDVTCTEVGLKIENKNPISGYRYVLTRNGTPIKTFTSLPADTSITDTGLGIKTEHKYELYSEIDGSRGITTGRQTVNTLDTTSHSITWQTFTFGQYGNSVLFDVAIIDENNIWAVGKIYLNDSLGTPDPNPYNALHWDGKKWEYKRINFFTICGGQGSYSSYPIRSIVSLNKSQIVVSGYDQIVVMDGFTQRPPACIPDAYPVLKMWGRSTNDIYVVGYQGFIAHLDGNKWTKIESGTDVDFLDVWGSPDGKVVWGCGYTDFKPTVLIRITGNKAIKVFESMRPMPLRKDYYSAILMSLWTNSTERIYVLTGSNLYYSKLNTQGEGKELFCGNSFNGGSVRLRGNTANDLFSCGNSSSIWHYNGVSWYEFRALRNPNTYLSSIDCKGSLVVATGDTFINSVYYQAVIQVGKTNNRKE